MLLGQKMLLLIISSCIKYNQCHAKLTKMSKNRFVMPGPSCGILNSIKFLHKLPQNHQEIQPCSILDLDRNHRESHINIDTIIAATTSSTPTSVTTTTITPTTTTTTTTTGKECHPDFIGDGTCRDLYIAKNQKLCQSQNSKWKNFAKAEYWHLF